jgi:hypothetical protein
VEKRRVALLLLCAVAGLPAGAEEPAWPAPAADLPDYADRGPEPPLPDPQQPLPGYLVWSGLAESPARVMRLNGDPGTPVCDDGAPDPARHCADPSLAGLVWPNAVTTHYSLTAAANADASLVALDNHKQCDAAGSCAGVPSWRSLYVAGPRHPGEPLGRPLVMRSRSHGGRACEERWHPTLAHLRVQVCHDDTIQLLDVSDGSQAQIADLGLLGYVALELGGGDKGQLAIDGGVVIPLRATREAPHSDPGTYCIVYGLDDGIRGVQRVTPQEHADWFWCGLDPAGTYLTVYRTENAPDAPGSLQSYDADLPQQLVAEVQACEEVSHFCTLVGPGPEQPAWVVGRRRFAPDCQTKPVGPMLRGDLGSGGLVEIAPDVGASHTSCTSDAFGVAPRRGWVLASQHGHQALAEVAVDASQRRKFVGWIRSKSFDPPHPLANSYFEKISEPQCTSAGTCMAVCATNWGSETRINSVLFDWSARCPGAVAVPALLARDFAAVAILLAAAAAWVTRPWRLRRRALP